MAAYHYDYDAVAFPGPASLAFSITLRVLTAKTNQQAVQGLLAAGAPLLSQTPGRFLGVYGVLSSLLDAQEQGNEGLFWVRFVCTAADLGLSAWSAAASCFAAGTPILTPKGHKAVEEFRPGDLVLARDEYRPESLAEFKAVEEVFATSAAVWEVLAGGRVIGTTSEHPFWVVGRGWTAARALQAGDRLLGHEGLSVEVEGVEDTGRWAAVYNMRVAGHHTYFVGCPEWGWSAWAHNACIVVTQHGGTRQARVGHWSVKVVRDSGSEFQTHQHPGLRPPRIVDAAQDYPGSIVGRPGTIVISDSQALTATALQLKLTSSGSQGDYHPVTNSCVSHVCEILVSAGVRGVPAPNGRS